MSKTPCPGPVILDIKATELSAEEKEILLHPHVGGVIFFSRHFESPRQMQALTQAIKKARPELLLCVDQEGGRVQRFKTGFTRLPPLKILGDWWDSQKVTPKEILTFSGQLGQLMALEVRSVGVDLSFAPVLDLGQGISTVIQDRAFHADPHIVAELATAYMQGMAHWGMSATAKHFPGHGSIALDSHLGLPEDKRASLEALTSDLYPFQALIQKQLPAIMTAHIVYPEIDPDPVSFSRYWCQTVLRQQLGFQGTLISDDLSMGGAVGMGSYADRAMKALEAGCDYILVCNHPEGAIEIIDAIKDKPDTVKTQRRMQLLANKPVPNWDALSRFPAWQQLQSSYAKASEDIGGIMSEYIC